MSRGKWAERDRPTEYRSRAELADELLDIAAEAHRLIQCVGVLSEKVRMLETKKAAEPRQRPAA